MSAYSKHINLTDLNGSQTCEIAPVIIIHMGSGHGNSLTDISSLLLLDVLNLVHLLDLHPYTIPSSALNGWWRAKCEWTALWLDATSRRVTLCRYHITSWLFVSSVLEDYADLCPCPRSNLSLMHLILSLYFAIASWEYWRCLWLSVSATYFLYSHAVYESLSWWRGHQGNISRSWNTRLVWLLYCV